MTGAREYRKEGHTIYMVDNRSGSDRAAQVSEFIKQGFSVVFPNPYNPAGKAAQERQLRNR
jgi:histidinol-phosphate/aromatic aminotransferase/cobyric acid decarboxylase-like protein